jgi:NTE family protein
MQGSIGLVLSGGGARGAYEAGVLLHIAEHHPKILERVKVVTGTSVGAVNAAFLASRGLSPSCVNELCDIWRSLAIDDLVSIDRRGVSELLAAGGKRLIGRAVESPPVGVLDVSGITKIVAERTDWRGLRRVVRSGRLAAVGFAATDIATGKTVFFVDHRDGVTARWSKGEDSPRPERTALGPLHVLASAAIPILFPPVAVAGRWFMDGGVRYNTPLSPALALGAESLLIVTVRAASDVHEDAPEGLFAGFGQIVGKVLDSVFLDRVGYDLDRLARINDWLASMDEVAPAQRDAICSAMSRRGRPTYRTVKYAHVQPSRDLGALASAHLGSAKGAGPFSFARVLRALFQDDAGTTGDAASFLLFDGGYAETLIQQGRADGERADASLAAL